MQPKQGTQAIASNDKKLTGKTALVTGAGRGLGRAYALRLAQLGADVVITDIRLDSSKEYGETLSQPTVMQEIKALGSRSLGIEADVTEKQQVIQMVEEAMGLSGRIDILVNNAGGLLSPVERSFPSIVPEEDLDLVFGVNLMGTIFCCQAVSVGMKKQGSGRIINVSSSAGLGVHEISRRGRSSHYGVAKAAIAQFTRELASELGPFGINVNAIAPAIIRTSRCDEQYNRKDAEEQAKWAKKIALGRMGTTEDCAKVLEFLATDLSDYVTGQCISVCGGYHLGPA